MPARYKRIHMPRPLYQEIEKFIESEGCYKTVGALCREAGRLLIKHYGLRDRYG